MVEPEPVLHLVLVNPEIPPNTGNVGRLCLGIGARLHVVHPIGFSIEAKAVRRAGLDYWKHVDLQEHPCLAAFWEWSRGRRVFLFSSHGRAVHTEPAYTRGDVLVFGCEGTGLPRELVQERGGFRIPMTGPIRSLNLSNAVAVVAYAALRTAAPELFDP